MSVPKTPTGTLTKKTKSYGVAARKLPNPTNWTLNEDTNGNLTGTVEYKYDFTYGSRIPDGIMPVRGDPHPYDQRIYAQEIHSQYAGNNLCVVTVNYAGFSGGSSSSGGGTGDFTWELTCPTSDEPIETHPNFFGMGVIDLDGQGKTVFVPYTGRDWSEDPNCYQTEGIVGQVKWNRWNVEVDNNQHFTAFKNNATMKAARLVGVRSYRRPGATMRVNFVSSSSGNHGWILENLGKYYGTIPFSEVRGDTNTNFEPRNWLMTSASVQKANRSYKYQVEFMLSGPKGWNPYIYMKGTTPTSPTNK